MLNIKELQNVTDSLRNQIEVNRKLNSSLVSSYYSYFPADSIRRAKAPKQTLEAKEHLPEVTKEVYAMAANKARNIRSFTTANAEKFKTNYREANNYEIEIYKKYTQSFACLMMFLIGAPLGAIIRKGGLGMPVIISIFFFIIYYVLTILGEKYGREGIMIVPVGMWAANAILMPIGLFFLYQARNDSNLLEFDFKKIFSRKPKIISTEIK